MTGSIAEDVANILEAEVGELSRYILKKQCAHLNISVDSIDEKDLARLALKLSDSVMVFGKDKAARVHSRVRALGNQEKKAEMGSENAFARHLELAEGARTLGNTIEERKHLERAAKCGMPSAPVFLARYHLLLGDLMLRQGEKKKAMKEFQEALDVSEKSGYEKGAEEAEYGIGNVYWRLGEYRKGMEVMKKCIGRCSRSRDERMTGKIYMALANIHDEWGKFEEALEYASIGKKKLTAVDDQYGLSTLHNNLGVLYARRGLYEESIGEYERCIETASKIGYTMMEGWAMFNAAEDHARMGNFSEAESLCAKSEGIFLQLKDDLGLSGVYMSYAVTHWLNENCVDAEKYFQNTLELRRKLSMPYRTADALYEYGRFLEDTERYDDAKKMFSESLSIFKTLNNRERVEQVERELKDIKSLEKS